MLQINSALKKLFSVDPGLKPFEQDLRMHLERYLGKRKSLGKAPLSEFANGHLHFGILRSQASWTVREWLPGADRVWLYGDFNSWNKNSHPLVKGKNDVWELSLPGENALCHGQFVKLLVERDGKLAERLPAYTRRAVMDEKTYRLCAQIWDPESPFVWTDGDFAKRRSSSPLIYEAHIGMAQDKLGVGTYREFADLTLPRIEKAGYNTIQLMAIAEHPYYASFGYQVTNFFAPSSRFGTPEDLKYLVNKAHQMGIRVLLDVVHSHACPNVGEGLHLQDGTEDQYFLPGNRGWHPAWNTKCFDYCKNEVLHFLLSNLKYWMEEFHFDGFRFDGVTSMLYEDHGLGSAFTHYGMYYSLNTNVDAKVYLMLANELVHQINKKAITVCEDMSGMPGMCLPLTSGGVGFDYRLSMGIPDLWIKLIKETPMEHWNVFTLWHELTGGRPGEASVGYCESHDQAMVGDKTVFFRLADAQMYTGMEKSFHSPIMDNAMEMHKLIRLLTATLSQGGYLNFMGNEFGHPEWIDFPREGNGWSYHYARRQWSLVDNGLLKYEFLANFDRAMIELLVKYRLFEKPPKSLWLDEEKNLMIYSRGELLFAFNLHPTQSRETVYVNCDALGTGDYQVVLSSDQKEFGGQERMDRRYRYRAQKTEHGIGFFVYLPCRSALVLKKQKNK